MNDIKTVNTREKERSVSAPYSLITRPPTSNTPVPSMAPNPRTFMEFSLGGQPSQRSVHTISSSSHIQPVANTINQLTNPHTRSCLLPTFLLRLSINHRVVFELYADKVPRTAEKYASPVPSPLTSAPNPAGSLSPSF